MKALLLLVLLTPSVGFLSRVQRPTRRPTISLARAPAAKPDDPVDFVSPDAADDGDELELDAADDGDELELDKLSRKELDVLMDDIGGPPMAAGLSVDEARAAIWEYLGEAEDEDLERMCHTQLSALMVNLGGPLIDASIPIEQARDMAWAYVESLDDGVFEYEPDDQ